jgi:hypothetical protein
MRSQERQRRARRACTALLCSVVSFVGLQAGLTWAMEKWVPHLRAPYYAFKADRLKERIRRARADEKAGAPPAKVVVMLGSSRAADGLRGGLVEEELSKRLGQPVVLFNFGIAGNTPMNQLLDLERLFDRGVRPDLVLVEVLPSTLADSAVALLDLLPAERMGLWDRRVLRDHYMPVGQLRRYSWKCWALPWYTHRIEMLSVLAPRLVPRWVRQDGARGCDRSGWYLAYPNISAPARENARKTTLASYGPVLRVFRLGSPFAPALARTLKRCRDAQVPAALVLMPEGSEFRDLYSPLAWQQLEGFLEGLSREYKVPVVNAREWVPDRHFLDTHHLLPEGAAMFTRKLARSVVLPMLREQVGPTPQSTPPPRVVASRLPGRP